MRFKYWFYINESIDADTEKALIPFMAKFTPEQREEAEKELQSFRTSPDLVNRGQVFGALQKLIQKKEKSKTEEDAFRNNWNTRGSDEDELKVYDYYKNEPKDQLTEMMELIRKFADKKIITIEFENNKPVLFRNVVDGKQKLNTPDFTRFMSELHGIESSLTRYKANKQYFNPMEEELNHLPNLVAKGDNIWVFKGHISELCRIFGKNQRWCISSSNSPSTWFNYRIEHHQTQYFVFDFNKDEDDPARYVNPGVAPPGKYSEWVDAQNNPVEDPEDPNSKVGINGYRSINEYKKYLASKGIPLDVWVTTDPEDWEKRLEEYYKTQNFSDAKNDPDSRIFPMYLKVVIKMKDEDFETLNNEQKIQFLMGKCGRLTDNQFEYANKIKGYFNSLQENEKLIFFIKKGNLDLVKELFEKVTPIRSIVIESAAEKGRLDIVKFLVEKSANMGDAVYLASQKGHLDVVKYLLGDEVNLNGEKIKLPKGRVMANFRANTLESAAEKGHLNIVKYFVERGVSIGDDAVYLAAEKGHFDIVKFLVEKGANIRDRTVENAAEKGHLDIVKYLVEKGANIGGYTVAYAVENDDLDIVKYLVEKGANIGHYALGRGAKNGNLDIINYLLGYEVIFNGKKIKLPEGCEPAKIEHDVVYFAAMKGHLNVVKYFLEKKAPIGAAVESAAENGHLKVVKYLVEKGGYISSDLVGIASEKGHQDIADYLQAELEKT
jgi:ankyrin repeat protein